MAAGTDWRATSSIERIRLLQQGLAKMYTKKDLFVSTMVKEMGKPMREAEEEMEAACCKSPYWKVMEQSLQPSRRGPHSLVVREPLGLVAVLSPWNFPCDEILLLTLPALASGNTVVVKPSEVTPLTGALTVETLASVLPEGVLQLAQGDGGVGSQLVSHPATAMVAMTGSSATGRQILRQGAPAMQRFVLELGGNDPMVVFADCDLEKTVQDAVTYSLQNAGQVCCSVERVLVEESIYSEFVELVVDMASSQHRVGNGANPDTTVGPLVSMVQLQKVQEQVNDALDRGARLAYQSTIPAVQDHGAGFFFPITVLADVTDSMQIYRSETFGPVISISSFGTEQQAVTMANDTEYGLMASVYTTDHEKALRVANQIQAGQVGLNCYALNSMDVSCPWVGHKASGYGFHSGPEGFHNFSIPKSLVSNDAIEATW